MRHALLVAAILLVVPFTGCTEDLSMGADGGGDTTITKYAAVNVENKDAAQARLRLTSTLGGEQVDATHYTFPANGSHELSLGLPSQGHVEILIQHQDTGKELRFTIGAGSCRQAVINVELSNGAPHSQGITCT